MNIVERKREPPAAPRFGVGAAAFANTLGCFILLGVDDDGNLHGWTNPARRDLQSYLAELLRQQVDPLPPFVAGIRTLDGKSIGVVRVFESADAPHIVRGTGALYLRSSKGKEPVPIEDQRTLIELARRGEEAEVRARDRLRTQPVRRRPQTNGTGDLADPARVQDANALRADMHRDAQRAPAGLLVRDSFITPAREAPSGLALATRIAGSQGLCR